jgi:hypothetical protein
MTTPVLETGSIDTLRSRAQMVVTLHRARFDWTTTGATSSERLGTRISRRRGDVVQYRSSGLLRRSARRRRALNDHCPDKLRSRYSSSSLTGFSSVEVQSWSIELHRFTMYTQHFVRHGISLPRSASAAAEPSRLPIPLASGNVVPYVMTPLTQLLRMLAP